MRAKRGVGIAGVLAIAVWFALFRPQSLGGPMGYVVVNGSSMLPTLEPGDLVLLWPHERYEIGDIISYRTANGSVIHRVVATSAERGYSTQGDNTPRPDQWDVSTGSVMGKAWLRAPGVGIVLEFLRQPATIGVTAALIAFVTLLGWRKTRPKRQRPRLVPAGAGRARYTRGQIGAFTALGMLGVVGLSAGTVGYLSFRAPPTTPLEVERGRWQHSARLEYQARVTPSTLYRSSVVGPEEALYTRLTNGLDLSLSYALDPPSPNVSGSYDVSLVLAAKDGWRRQIELLAPSRFVGSTFRAQASIDVAEIRRLIEVIEKETAASPPGYEMRVVPTIRLEGNVAGSTLKEVYAPSFVFGMNKAQITAPPTLELARKQRDVVIRTDPARLGLFGLSEGVATLRWLSVAVLAIAAAAASFIALILFGGLGAREHERIRVRHGSMLVDVRESPLAAGARVVRVASMGDLVRIAMRGSETILHQALPEGQHRYVYRDGTLSYEYLADAPARAAAGRGA